jgi:hypothetical protein
MSDYMDALRTEADTIGGGLQPPPDYMDALRQQADKDARLRMSATTAQALDTNPDRFAEQRKVAARLGLQPAVVEALPNEMQRRDQMQRIAEIICLP